MEELRERDCLDWRPEGSGCGGEVDYRMALSASGKPYPRCDVHWDKRLVEQERIDRLYAPNSDVPPADFDPTYAGERWDDDY